METPRGLAALFVSSVVPARIEQGLSCGQNDSHVTPQGPANCKDTKHTNKHTNKQTNKQIKTTNNQTNKLVHTHTNETPHSKHFTTQKTRLLVCCVADLLSLAVCIFGIRSSVAPGLPPRSQGKMRVRSFAAIMAACVFVFNTSQELFLKPQPLGGDFPLSSRLSSRGSLCPDFRCLVLLSFGPCRFLSVAAFCFTCQCVHPSFQTLCDCVCHSRLVAVAEHLFLPCDNNFPLRTFLFRFCLELVRDVPFPEANRKVIFQLAVPRN